jgi:hypothetical protein
MELRENATAIQQTPSVNGSAPHLIPDYGYYSDLLGFIPRKIPQFAAPFLVLIRAGNISHIGIHQFAR